MYLDFIKDIFKPGDTVKIQGINGIVIGVIIKLSSELIAIKSKEGQITIVKDKDITDISSFYDDNGSNNNLDKNETNFHTESSLTNKQVGKTTHGRDLTLSEIEYIVDGLHQKLESLVELTSIIKHNAVLVEKLDDVYWQAKNNADQALKVKISGCISKNNIEPGLQMFANSETNGIIHTGICSMTYSELLEQFKNNLIAKDYAVAITIVSAIRLMTGSVEIKSIQKLISKIRNNSTSFIESYNKLYDSLRIGEQNSISRKENDIEDVTVGFCDETWPFFDKKHLLKIARGIKASLTKKERTSYISSNANIVEVKKRTFWVQSGNLPKQGITTKTIVERSLLSTIENFEVGDYCPVSIFAHKDYPGKIILTTSQMTLEEITDLLIATIAECHYLQSKLLCYFMMSIVEAWNTKKGILEILNILKPISISQLVNTVVNPKEDSTKASFGVDAKNQEKLINSLIKDSKQGEAILMIDDILSTKKLDSKYKSSLLLKKAQTYSAIKAFDNAEVAYAELVAFLESVKGTANNLSHLYTELARLQSMHVDKIDDAVASVTKALKYNPDNKYASSLLSQLTNGKQITEIQIEGNNSDEEDDEGILDSGFEDSTITISKLIDIDIKEHKYTSERIIENGGVSTPEIAKEILEEAKTNKNVDLSERYPIYLEAAKAFNDLPVGSYDFQDFVESAAYYSIFKGNSLFLKFRKLVQDGNRDIEKLTSIKDSACSYYIESLNLQSSIPASYMLTLFSNYVKLNIVINNFQKEEFDFSGQINKVFFKAVKSDDIHQNNIAWEAVLAIGAASGSAWGKILRSKRSFRMTMNSLFKDNVSSQRICFILNELCHSSIEKKKRGGDFLRSCFSFRRNQLKQLSEKLLDFRRKDLDLRLIPSIVESWNMLNSMLYLFSSTDICSKDVVDRVLSILSPYANRNQSERMNLLLQTQRMITEQMKFINDNATYYGRTFFYPLFAKWI